MKTKKNDMSPKDILIEQANEQEAEKFCSNKINWLEDEYWNEWGMVKGKSKKFWGNGDILVENFDVNKLFFLAHCRDEIRGRPQLIESVQKKIPLVRYVVKTDKDTKEEIKNFIFFDENYDKRYDGNIRASFALDFWMYRIISEQGKEYYILTQEELPNEVCNFTGMLVEMNDFAEMSKSMKIKSLSRLFFLKEFKSDVQILEPEKLVEFTKNKKVDEKCWLDFLAYHPQFNSFNRFPGDIEVMKSAHLLSSKVDGYPLHLGVMGPQGTRKSKGYIETVAYKFSDEPDIVEGANSRIKGLSPSFKEKPANLGYLVNSNRMGWVDEIGKMVEFEMNKHQGGQGNVLGELNSLLDHSIREVVSGNDNSVKACATAKFCFVLNPVSGKKNIGRHVGIIDATTMSRMLWWVQDEAEQEFVKSKEGITRIPPTHKQALARFIGIKNKNITNAKLCVGGNLTERSTFLTIFDTCQSFLCIIDDERVERLSNTITQLAFEPMKGVWEPRKDHHTKLLIDGLIKHRCLFKDYDPTFTAKEEDYELAERILVRMVNSWGCDLSAKLEGYGV